MRAAAPKRNPLFVTIRFLAPAGPVTEGHAAVVRANARLAPARWDWDDGHLEETSADALGGDRPMRRTHRYAHPGVYLVRVLVDGATDWAARYVTVRARHQLGACGWVRDEGSRARIPFGFLLTPGAGEHSVIFRCLLADGEFEAVTRTWAIADAPNAIHFGGQGRLRDGGGRRRFRVDLRNEERADRGAQRLTLTLYSLRGVPGRDSPRLRITGTIRPGRADVRTW